MDKAVINQLALSSLRSKRVFVRIDIGEERSSAIGMDEINVREFLPTLEYLTSVGARIVIGTHWGNPGGAPAPGPRPTSSACSGGRASARLPPRPPTGPPEGATRP